jgi:hypothetical protein
MSHCQVFNPFSMGGKSGRRVGWLVSSRCGMKRSEVFQQQPVDEHIPATHLAQEEAFSSVVQKSRVAPRRATLAGEHETEHEVLEEKRGQSRMALS